MRAKVEKAKHIFMFEARENLQIFSRRTEVIDFK